MNSMRILAFLVLTVSATNPAYTILQNAQTISQLSTFVALVSSPGYESIFNILNSPGTLTMFAPNNDAFTKANLDTTNVTYVSDLLLYHMLPTAMKCSDFSTLQFNHTLANDPHYVNIGYQTSQVLDIVHNATVTLNSGTPSDLSSTADVVQADMVSSNGVLHVIDRVELFPLLVSQSDFGNGLNAFNQALYLTGMTSVADNTPQLTLFIPTDAAFQKAGINVATMSIANLTNLVAYHIIPSSAIPGVGYSTQLKDAQVLRTYLGTDTVKLSINTSNGGQQKEIKVVADKSSAIVSTANVLTQNGVVHIIDAVLIPSCL